MFGVLSIDFCGIVEEVDPAHGRSSFTFGRSGDLSVDEDNRYLHRHLGQFRWDGQRWWVDNLGKTIPINLHNAVNNTQAVLTPGASLPVGSGAFSISFTAGPHHYLVEGFAAESDVERWCHAESAPDGEPTQQWGVVEVNHEQRLLITALAEPQLLDPTVGPTVLPTNRAVAHDLGWTITKLNRKLDHICEKFARAGVKGIQGDIAGLATERRVRLVRHCIEVGIVSGADLGRLASERARVA
jgi:hypothetical protein